MRVPILCYHRIEAPPAQNPADSNYVTPAQFAAHIAALARLGCTGVTVRDIVRWQRGELELPRRAVAITFDDAYESVPAAGLPVLAQHGWPGTIYAVASQLGGTNAWDPGAPPATLLDAAALRDLAAQGHEIGSHSRRHQRLTGLAAADLTDELTGSRDALEQALGLPIRTVAFPYGSHDRAVLHAVAAAGYDGACTLKRWANSRRSSPLRLGRMSVGGPLGSGALLGKLAKLMLTPARR